MDLYAVLGVQPSASDTQIERAYRRLARRYHPGINPGDPVAEQRYRQIEQAYQILGDPGRRRTYDQGPSDAGRAESDAVVSFEGFDFSSVASGSVAATFSELFAGVFQQAARHATTPARGQPLEAQLAISFRDAVRGGRFPVSVVRQQACGACHGRGQVDRPASQCPHCQGQGATRWARGHMVFSRSCEACGGVGQLRARVCQVCQGRAVGTRSEVVTLDVPPGIDDGARVVVPGRGHVPVGGGPTGDLYVVVSVAPDPHFRREGRDLHLRLPVAVHEAALGARVDVPTLGEPMRLRIPPGTPSGRRLRLRGRGVPSAHGDRGAAGDLIVEVQIVLPPVRDERSRALLREFGELNAVDVRADLFEQ